HPLHQFDGTGCAGHHALAQRGQIEACEIGVLQFRDVHGGHTIERGGAAGGDGVQGGAGVELRGGQDEGGAVDARNHAADNGAETVIERHGRADAVVRFAAERDADGHAVVDQVAVGEQHALGRAGGAGGVLDVGDVAGGGGIGVVG